MTTRPRRRFWLKLAAGLLFAVVAYGGAYAAMVQPAGRIVFGAPGGGKLPARLTIVPNYRWSAISPAVKWAESFFRPVQWIDRRLRPRTWEPRSVFGPSAPLPPGVEVEE